MTTNLPAETSHRSERGQSLVELAISLTVMLLLLSGAVTFGMALFSYVAIRDAAGEGALYGSISPYHDDNANGQYDPGETVNGAAICARVKAASTRPVDMNSFTCTSDFYGNPANTPRGSGNWIDVSATTKDRTPSTTKYACEGSPNGANTNGILVTVEFDQPVFMPFMNALTGGTIHLRAQVTDTILEPRCPP
jgi:hypothetical protein